MTVKAAVIGSGNIGTDLMFKVMRTSETLEMGALVGIDPASDGLARAQRMGVTTTSDGVEGLARLDVFPEIDVIFDATSASAHRAHADFAAQSGKQIIDLTPAAIGPFVVPTVNLDENAHLSNVNMVTCGGQATIPIVAAVAKVVDVDYAEIIASIASRSAGPGTRANIDEFTVTTARAIESVGGATHGKAIIILNPAEPPLVMRDTVICLTPEPDVDEDAVSAAVEKMAEQVRRYVPGYRVRQDVQFSRIDVGYLPALGRAFSGTRITTFLDISGAGHYLPEYAGNLDIMTSAALQTAEGIAHKRGWK